MSVKIEQAIRSRKCRICNNEIEAGEYHLRFTGGRKMPSSDNICWYCLSEKLTEIKELNKEKEE